MLEEALLHGEAAAKAMEGTIGGQDAVAGEPERDRVGTDDGADGAGTAPPEAGVLGEPAVRAGFAGRYVAQGQKDGTGVRWKPGREVDREGLKGSDVAIGVGAETGAGFGRGRGFALDGAKCEELAEGSFERVVKEGGVADAEGCQSNAGPAKGRGGDGGDGMGVHGVRWRRPRTRARRAPRRVR